MKLFRVEYSGYIEVLCEEDQDAHWNVSKRLASISKAQDHEGLNSSTSTGDWKINSVEEI